MIRCLIFNHWNNDSIYIINIYINVDNIIIYKQILLICEYDWQFFIFPI